MPKKTIKKYEGPVFPVGSVVKLKRPNMWYSRVGLVTAVNPDSGEHLLRLTHKDGVRLYSDFGATALGTEMEIFK